MIIYKITNKINGKVYIGQTIRTLETRWKEHVLNSFKHKTSMCLHDSIRKYGAENFTIEQIDVASTRDELDKKEIYWIKYYNSLSPNGYNLETGGNKNHSISEETRIRMSKSQKGRVLSKEHREKIGNGNKNKIRSDETRKKISESKTGKPIKKFSLETRLKISKARLGCKLSNETKHKLSNLNKGLNNPRCRAVICVETDEIFDCILYASINKKVNKSAISQVCKGNRKTCGGYHWEYVQ